MDFSIISEILGVPRIKLAGPVPQADYDSLLKVASSLPYITSVKVYGQLGRWRSPISQLCAKALDSLTTIDAEAIEQVRSTYTVDLAPRTTNALFMDLAMIIGGHYARRWFYQPPSEPYGYSFGPSFVRITCTHAWQTYRSPF